MKKTLHLTLTPHLSVEELSAIKKALGKDLDPMFWRCVLDDLEDGETVTVSLLADPQKLVNAGFRVDEQSP